LGAAQLPVFVTELAFAESLRKDGGDLVPLRAHIVRQG
jgi:hypothetical protein